MFGDNVNCEGMLPPRCSMRWIPLSGAGRSRERLTVRLTRCMTKHSVFQPWPWDCAVDGPEEP